MIDGQNLNNGEYLIKQFVEKPCIKEAPSNLAADGLYNITPEVIREIDKKQKRKYA